MGKLALGLTIVLLFYLVFLIVALSIAGIIKPIRKLSIKLKNQKIKYPLLKRAMSLKEQFQMLSQRIYG